MINPEAFYMDFVQNYLRVSNIADAYGISDGDAKLLIDIGRQMDYERMCV